MGCLPSRGARPWGMKYPGSMAQPSINDVVLVVSNMFASIESSNSNTRLSSADRFRAAPRVCHGGLREAATVGGCSLTQNIVTVAEKRNVEFRHLIPPPRFPGIWSMAMNIGQMMTRCEIKPEFEQALRPFVHSSWWLAARSFQQNSRNSPLALSAVKK